MDAGSDQAVCSDPSPVIQLAGSFGGGAAGVTWTTSGTGTFGNPSSPVTNYTPSTGDILAGALTLTLTTDDPAGPCGAASDGMVLTITPAAAVDAGPDLAVCSDPAPVIQLAGSFGGGGGGGREEKERSSSFDLCIGGGCHLGGCCDIIYHALKGKSHGVQPTYEAPSYLAMLTPSLSSAVCILPCRAIDT